MVALFFLLSLLAVVSAQVSLCPTSVSDAYHNGICYLYVNKPANWLDALNVCESKGYKLISIKNENIEQFQSLNTRGSYNWLGLRCLGNSTNSCQWGSPSNPHKFNANDYSNFAAGHPNSQIGLCVILDCMDVDEAGDCLWKSADCSEVNYYTCTRSALQQVGRK